VDDSLTGYLAECHQGDLDYLDGPHRQGGMSLGGFHQHQVYLNYGRRQHHGRLNDLFQAYFLQ
jgi:hypothetical protein